MNKDAIKVDKMKYTAVFAITTLIFVLGFFLGSYASGVKTDKLDVLEQEFRSDIMALELQYEIIKENPCDSISVSGLDDQLYTLGSKLTYLESAEGENYQNIIQLKNYYSILQIRHWLITRKITTTCETPVKTIIYFYSNKDNCNNCDKQGYVLTFLRRKYPQIRTYTFDVEVNNVALESLKELYGIESDEVLPIIIIDGNVYYGFKDSDELVNLMDLELEITGNESINNTPINN